MDFRQIFEKLLTVYKRDRYCLLKINYQSDCKLHKFLRDLGNKLMYRYLCL